MTATITADMSVPPPEGTGACYVWTDEDELKYQTLSSEFNQLESRREACKDQAKQDNLKNTLLSFLDILTGYVKNDNRHCHAFTVALPRRYNNYSSPVTVKLLIDMDHAQANALFDVSDHGEISL